jgi:hypothetical protein
MTTRTDYTAEQWDLLTDMPRLAAFGAMASEASGPVTSTRELWASMMELAKAARTSYPDNTLIQEVTRDIERSGKGADMTASDWDPQSGEELAQGIVEQTLLTAPKVRQALAAEATPEEAAEYTAWVLGIARAGVDAARTGLFGLSGELETEREVRFLEDLAIALGVEESRRSQDS